MASTSVSGKVVAITGGASGIGLATAHLLASRGAHLSLADLNDELLDTVSEDIRTKYPGTKVLATALDVRDAAAVDAWVQSTVQTLGKLSGAANLAGVIGKSIGLHGIRDQDEDEWAFILGVNLTGVMHCMRAQLRVLEDGGSVVNASSIAGVQGRRNNAAYAASKHGVVGLTRSAAKEEGPRGVRVNCIAPGYIKTPMTELSDKLHTGHGLGTTRNREADGTALGRVGEADEVASLICFLLGDESKFITGTVQSIDGGMAA